MNELWRGHNRPRPAAMGCGRLKLAAVHVCASLLALPSALTAGPSGDFSRQWMEAVQLNSLAAIAEQLREMKDVNVSTANGKTALMAAAAGGSTQLVKTLIEAGAIVTAENRSSGTALMYAASAGDSETITLLIKQGARIDHQASNGWSALMMAVAKGYPEACRTLLENGAKVDLPDMYGWTPLMRAAYEGRVQVAGVLLRSSEIDLEKRNVQGQTALHLAVLGRRADLVTALIGSGANVSQEDFQGRSALQVATETGDNILAEMLAGALQQTAAD